MRYLLDTNIIIFYSKGKNPKILEHFAKIHQSRIAIPSLVIGELEYGARKSEDYQKRMTHYNEFLSHFNVIDFDRKAALFFGAVRNDLEARGKMIGPIDTMIAAIALANDCILVTHNVDEFSRVKGLQIQDWTL